MTKRRKPREFYIAVYKLDGDPTYSAKTRRELVNWTSGSRLHEVVKVREVKKVTRRKRK